MLCLVALTDPDLAFDRKADSGLYMSKLNKCAQLCVTDRLAVIRLLWRLYAFIATIVRSGSGQRKPLSSGK